MKTQAIKSPAARQTLPAAPQLAVRSGVRAGRTEDCSLGLGYWRKELNTLKSVAQALNCD